MKIYHTETQEDYDALMVELERQGCKWLSGRKPTSLDYWEQYGEKTGIEVGGSGLISKGVIEYLEGVNPQAEVIKYKAKADDKMRFTKDNVYRLFGDYRRNKNGIHRLDNLESVIMDLDDTPEKVVVPKFVAEWIEWNKQMGVSLRNMLRCYKHFCENTDPIVSDGEKAVQWYVDNPYKFIQAYEDGYTIAPEKLYYIPLPELQTSDGLQQVLSKRKGDKHYFASRPNEKLKQRYAKEELERVPEVYKPYAKPIEEEVE